MKRIRRTGNPVGRVARPGTWLKTGSASGGDSPWPNPGSEFYALAPDPTTGEMTGVINGTGGLTTTHADTLYAPDINGVYQAFPADQPVWTGGEATLAAGPGSAVTGYKAVPGEEMPYLQYTPAATNLQVQSRNSDLSWTISNNGTVVADAVGIDGTPNTASTITDNETSLRAQWQPAVTTVPSSTNPIVNVFWIAKDTGSVNYILFRLRMSGGTNHDLLFRPSDGDVGGATTATYEIIDLGGWWKVLVQFNNESLTTNQKVVDPVYSSDGVNADNSLTGYIIVGQVEVHDNKTIAEVRGLGPVFTQSAAVSVARTEYSFDASNHAETGAYYFENIKNGNGAILDAFLEVISPNYQLEDGVVVVTQGWTENTAQKVGAVSEAANQMVLNVDGVYGTDGVFNGTLLGIPFDLYRGGLYGDRIRNLQRYDIASYAEGKAIIDGLMT